MRSDGHHSGRCNSPTGGRSADYWATSEATFATVGCLRSFRALSDFGFDCVSFLQALISLGGDSAVMDEHVRSIVPSDKSVPLGVIEPLYRSFHTFHVPPLACTLWLDQGRAVMLCDIVRPAHSAVKGVIARKPTIHALSRHFCAMRARGWQKWFCCREWCLLAPCEAQSTARPAACE